MPVKMTPLDFPVDLLDKLKLDKIFRESAEYFLECDEKMQMYKEEKLIKPLYEESRIYVEEIRTILYALTRNKNLDKNAREVFYNYLCFDRDHSQTIKVYFRNLSEKYISKLRSIFSLAHKESEKLKNEPIEVEYNNERFNINASSIVISSADTIGELQREQLKINDLFHAVKNQALETYSQKMGLTNLLTDIETFFTQFKDDLSFYLGKVKNLLKEDEFKLLVEVTSNDDRITNPSLDSFLKISARE